MAESIFLSKGGNILDFNAGEPSLVAALRAADEESSAPWTGQLVEDALPAIVDRRKPRVRGETVRRLLWLCVCKVLKHSVDAGSLGSARSASPQ